MAAIHDLLAQIQDEALRERIEKEIDMTRNRNNMRRCDNMNTNDLNTALYEKMAAEQDKYRDWLKSQPPGRNPAPHL